jgi:ribosomal protein S18 acetylase RimI-like enzyme
MSIEFVPFTTDLIEDAAILLASHHRQDCRRRPELPARFAQPEDAQRAIAVAFQRPQTEGVAALCEGKLLGYLFGTLTIDSLWGRTGWMRRVGCALALDQPLELLADLYARLGQQWVKFGCFAHYVVAPILDPALVHTWFSLGFGIEQVHGLCPLSRETSGGKEPTNGIEIRRATPEDQSAISEFSDVIWRQHVLAPCWAVQLPENIAKTRDGWAKLTDDPKVDLWLALEGERLVGIQGYWTADPEEDDLLWPEHCVNLGIAGTHPGARRRGIARELMRVGLEHARQQGNLYCETDWRSANLPARRCWQNLGFTPYAYRLVRRLDLRISWANGGNSHALVVDKM